MHIDVWGYDGDVPLSAEIVTAGGLVTLIPNEDDGELNDRFFSPGSKKPAAPLTSPHTTRLLSFSGWKPMDRGRRLGCF